jgi:protein-ribulosamine 3-kinase
VGSLADRLTAATGRRFAVAPAGAVAGGDINHCVRWDTDGGPVFVKVAPVSQRQMFEAEAEGLEELAAASVVRVPRVLGICDAGAQAALALEWIEFGAASRDSESRLGERLAAQHGHRADRFGWHRDNMIGRTPQLNAWSDDWVRFYVERRLIPQLQLAAADGMDPRTIERGHQLGEKCDAFFAGYRPVPSLLHGDLWAGNWAAAAKSGEPVLFDPAVYYGDREADLAMTQLFGGFGATFYRAYEAAWPLDRGAAARRTLYNLYHVLNHWHLFGGGYGGQAAVMIDRLLAEL